MPKTTIGWIVLASGHIFKMEDRVAAPDGKPLLDPSGKVVPAELNAIIRRREVVQEEVYRTTDAEKREELEALKREWREAREAGEASDEPEPTEHGLPETRTERRVVRSAEYELWYAPDEGSDMEKAGESICRRVPAHVVLWTDEVWPLEAAKEHVTRLLGLDEEEPGETEEPDAEEKE